MTEKTKIKQKRKLDNLSALQDRPLLNTSGYLKVLDDIKVPHVVEQFLRLGPKNPVLTKFEEEKFLAKIDVLLKDCKDKNEATDVTNKINALTLGYIAKCKTQRLSRPLIQTKRWLKVNNCVAVPYDKGCGYCIMKQDSYHAKLRVILNGRQFEKLPSASAIEAHRINAWHYV